MPVCRYYLAGNCRYGSACRNSHQERVCTFFSAGNCKKGLKCDFKHEKCNSQEKLINSDKATSTESCGKDTNAADDNVPHTYPNSGFRFLRIPSTFDNLSNKFRFNVPSPSPDVIFYSSDSDWCESVNGEERLGSCTLDLYTCYKCQDQVLAEEGKGRLTCSKCETGQGSKEEVEPDEIVEKKKVKKKKRKKKAVIVSPFSNFVPEKDVYETPEGVKVYRAKEENVLITDLTEQSEPWNKIDIQDEDLDTFVQIESLDSEFEEPRLNMNEAEFIKVTMGMEEVGGKNDDCGKLHTEPKSDHCSDTIVDPSLESQDIPSNDQPKSFHRVPWGPSKETNIPKKLRTKNQKKRNRKHKQKHEVYHPSEVFSDDPGAVKSSSLIVSFVFILDMVPIVSKFTVCVVSWLLELLLYLLCLLMAVTLYLLRLAIVLAANAVGISLHLTLKIMNFWCFYMLHPSLLKMFKSLINLWLRTSHQLIPVSKKHARVTVPLLNLDRWESKGCSRNQFSCTESRLNYLAGVRCEDEKVAERHFTQGLEIEQNNARLLAARSRARYRQFKLCLALEDLCALDRLNIEDLMVGAKCYLGLGMLDIVHTIVAIAKDSDDVNPSELNQLIMQLMIEETLNSLPDDSQVEMLNQLVKVESVSSLRHKVKLAELTRNVVLMEEILAKLENGEGEQAAYHLYLTGLVQYYTGYLHKAELTLLSCVAPCRVARCKYLAQVAASAEEKLELANHCLRWGRVKQGEELFRSVEEVDLNNPGLAKLVRLGLAKCSLANDEPIHCLALCCALMELPPHQLDRKTLVEVVIIMAETLLVLTRYQEVVKLVMGVPNYKEVKELVNLLNKAKQELGQGNVKSDKGSYYDLLGIDRSAGEVEIKAAFKKLARENHPDKFVDASEKVKQEEIMKNINQAYSILSDENSRAEYDAMRDMGSKVDQNMSEEEIIKVFEKFFDEVKEAASKWAESQAMKGKKVNKNTLNLYISDYLLNNKEYFMTKYKLHAEVFKAFRDSFMCSNGSQGRNKNKRRK